MATNNAVNQSSAAYVTDQTTFALLNTTATTINFGGAATTLNMAGGSGAAINLGGGANAAELRFLEPSGSGTNYSAFKAQAQGANITYTLPSAVGAAGTFLTDAAGNGTLSWAAASGGVQKTIMSFSMEDLGTSGNKYTRAVTGSAAVTNGLGGANHNTGTTSGSGGAMAANEPGNANSAVFFDLDPEIHAVVNLASDGSGNFVSQIVASGDETSLPDTSGNSTIKHFGFILDGAVLYASNANGTTQTKTDVSSGITVTNTLFLKAIMDSGTNIKFYINGTLVATHTTNLPSGDTHTNRLWCSSIKNDAGTTTDRSLYLGSVTLMLA
jgi:hypothetical protein